MTTFMRLFFFPFCHSRQEGFFMRKRWECYLSKYP